MKQYIVDAFTKEIFKGNPAAVCVMESWLSADTMQKIAIENNLSETAFAVKNGTAYHLRWFTPGGEVELCGHATLATAYVILRFIEPELNSVAFDTLSGRLTVEKQGGLLKMDFPSFALTPIPVTEQITLALGATPIEAYRGLDIVCVLENEDQVRQVVPNQEIIRQTDSLCLHITTPGNTYDCVTRTFAPKCNVAEYPVYGRAHCHVIPLWFAKRNQAELTAYQASPRGGVLHCRYAGVRTIISGNAALYSEAEIFI